MFRAEGAVDLLQEPFKSDESDKPSPPSGAVFTLNRRLLRALDATVTDQWIFECYIIRRFPLERPFPGTRCTCPILWSRTNGCERQEGGTGRLAECFLSGELSREEEENPMGVTQLCGLPGRWPVRWPPGDGGTVLSRIFNEKEQRKPFEISSADWLIAETAAR